MAGAHPIDQLFDKLNTDFAAGSPPDVVELTGFNIFDYASKDVLEPLLQNLSNKEIAGKLNISERTVKFHVSNLLAKFSVQRRADLILHSFQSRALSPQPGRANLEDTPPHPPRFTRPRAAS